MAMEEWKTFLMIPEVKEFEGMTGKTGCLKRMRMETTSILELETTMEVKWKKFWLQSTRPAAMVINMEHAKGQAS